MICEYLNDGKGQVESVAGYVSSGLSFSSRDKIFFLRGYKVDVHAYASLTSSYVHTYVYVPLHIVGEESRP